MSGWNGTSPDRTTLVTGGAGFVGTNLAHRLASEGVRVVIYDDLSRSGASRNLRWLTRRHRSRIEVELADVTRRRRLQRVVERVDAVFHLAAQVAVTTSIRDPEADFSVNLGGTLNLLEALRRIDDPPPLVFTSTNKVYGRLGDLALDEGERAYRPVDRERRSGIDESQPLDFRSPYGCSKGAADQYVLDYARTFGIPATVFRMSCVYGPHQHGTEDQGWVAHFVLQALRSRPITIFGDGKQVRDVLHVSDLVDALLRAVERSGDVAGRAFNLGGGPENALSLLQLLDQLDELGPTPEVRFDAWRAGDQRWYVSDTSAFHEVTGWTPDVSRPEGIAGLHRWLADHRTAPADDAASALAVG